MRTIEKFRFRLNLHDGDLYDSVDIIWLAPSGAEFLVGNKTAGSLHRYIGRVVDHTDPSSIFTACMNSLRDVVYRPHGPRRREFLDRCQYGPTRAPYYTGARHGLDKNDRAELGALVRQCMQDGDTDPVIEFLNDNHVSKSIIARLPSPLDGLDYGRCGHFHDWGEEYRHNDGGTLCDHCANDEDRYIRPEHTRLFYDRDDVYYHEGPGCWRTYPEDRDDDNDDDEDSDDAGMLNYSTDVTYVLHGPKFASSPLGPFTIGVELEVEAQRGERSEFVSTILAQVGKSIICKHDGSLADNRGVELVSVPMEYREALTLFGSLDFPVGTRAWDGGNCGLHVHVDARAFTPLSIAKFLAFWNHRDNAKLIRRVAGRHPIYDPRAQDYAALSDAGRNANVVQAAKHHEHGESRYRLINTMNLKHSTAETLGLHPNNERPGRTNTIEIRIFRASLRKERMLAQIEMAAASVYFARDTSLQAVLAKDFERWLSRNVALFPHLASFLKLTRPMVPNPNVEIVHKDEPVDVDTGDVTQAVSYGDD